MNKEIELVSIKEGRGAPMPVFGEDIQTFLFDKDGTLIDLPSIWIPWAYDIHRHLAEVMPNCPFSLAEFGDAVGIWGEDEVDPKSPLAIASLGEMQAVIAFLLYEKGVAWDSAVLFARDSIQYADEKQNSSAAIRPVHGVRELLTELKKAERVLGVVTADDTEKARVQLERVGLAEYFDFVIGSDQVQNGKPYPDMAYLARDRHGIALGQTVIVGDTNADMQLGKSAGLKATIGIAANSRNETAHLAEADLIVTSYSELLDMMRTRR
ncbi:HAD family hydrolase [Brevibacillus agri]|uniref:HAD family hydrolase n=1 Tax=Brevibacillus agri TaxID=51101 RepID=UPI000B1502D0|nr:HAD family hydrolase [Brevibacillus agri]